jgi:hypothetical protein
MTAKRGHKAPKRSDLKQKENATKAAANKRLFSFGSFLAKSLCARGKPPKINYAKSLKVRLYSGAAGQLGAVGKIRAVLEAVAGAVSAASQHLARAS